MNVMYKNFREQMKSRYLEPLPIYSPLRLEGMRKKIFLTQGLVAELCRVKVATWRNWESGRVFMPEVAWAYFNLNVYKPIRKDLKQKYKNLEKTEKPDNW